MRSSVRWMVPVTVVAAIAGGTALNSAAADSPPNLPTRTPQELVAAVAAGKVTALSGTVVTHANLGLPALPQLGGAGGSTPSDVQGLVTRFLSGQNTMRVWTDGGDRQRMQLLDSFDELNVIHNADQIWLYSAKQNLVKHGTIGQDHRGSATTPSGAEPSAAPSSPAPKDLTPDQVAQQALAAVGPSTTVSVGTPETVAGRSAYALTLTPKTADTLVNRVVIDIDADKSVPLQVKVFARGGSDQPAIETGFSSVDFSTPSASEFTFTPPKGAKVEPLSPPDANANKPGTGDIPSTHVTPATPAAGHPKPTVTGSGWSSIVELPAGSFPIGEIPGAGTPAVTKTPIPSAPASEASDSPDSQRTASLINQISHPVTGGRVINTTLVTVFISSDGRVFAGAVPEQYLINTVATMKK